MTNSFGAYRHMTVQPISDTLAERLRRRPAKPMGSPRMGSNPTGVVSFGVIGILQKSIEAPDVIDA